MKHIFTSLPFAILLLLNVSCEKRSYPNIVYILADDMGYGDVSYLNPSSGVQTPAIDRMAEEGIYFSDAHSPSAVCTPTRYGILTGRYSFRTRLKSGVLVGYSPPLIEPGQMTVASMLKSKGYQTAAIGKWHLGLEWGRKNTALPLYPDENEWDIQNTSNIDYASEIKGGPTDHGFDYSFINPASLDIAPYVYISNKHVTGQVIEHIEGENSERGVFWRHGDRADDFYLEEALEKFSDKAVEFIEKSDQKNPFFLYLALTAPHTPWLPSASFKGSSNAGTYGDFVQQVDQSVKDVLTALENKGLSKNTIVIFTSDNGAHWTEEDKSKFPHRANYTFSGMKSDVWEGGHRVPFIVRWPGQIKEGSSSEELICLTDLFATLSSILDFKTPAGTAEDSYSFVEALHGEQTNDVRPYVIHHSVNGVFAIRKGKWKLIDHPGSGGWTYTGKDELQSQQLYNMQDDPEESVNLIHENSEIADSLNTLLHELKMTTTN